MNTKCRSLITLLLTLSPLLLSACGGGSASGSSASSPATVSASVVQGVAASGSPLTGKLSLSDCSFPNRSTSTSINQDGTFSISTEGMSPPFLIRASGNGVDPSGNPLTIYFYSFAISSGTVNVNPLTDLLVASAAGASDDGALAGLFANHNRASLQTIANNLPGSISNLQSALLSLSSLYGITALDPFTYGYQINHQGLDGLFDDVRVGFFGGKATLTNKTTGAAFYSALLGNLGGGTLLSASLPKPTPYPKPGNARLTLLLSGLPSSDTLVKHLKTTIQLPLGVTFKTYSTTSSAVVNTAIPSGGGLGAIVYPSPTLSTTNNQMSIELSSLKGFGAGEFLTLRCIVSFDQLSIIKATDFSVLQTQVYGDIYKQQKLKSGTVTTANLLFPAVEGNTVYTGLCAGCHTLGANGTVGKPTLLNTASQIPATFAKSHHSTSLTQQQIEDLQAYLTSL